MLTAQEARRLQKESFTLRGRVVDAITAAAKRNESEVVIPRLNLSDKLRRELENKGYFINGNVISWYEISGDVKEDIKQALRSVDVEISDSTESASIISDGTNPNKEQK